MRSPEWSQNICPVLPQISDWTHGEIFHFAHQWKLAEEDSRIDRFFSQISSSKISDYFRRSEICPTFHEYLVWRSSRLYSRSNQKCHSHHFFYFFHFAWMIIMPAKFRTLVIIMFLEGIFSLPLSFLLLYSDCLSSVSEGINKLGNR